MTHEALKRIRFLYPGVVVALLIAANFWADKITAASDLIENSYAISLDNIIPIAFIVIVGIMYSAFKIRNIIWKPMTTKFQKNIVVKLLQVANRDLACCPPENDYHKLVNSVFYKIVDKDESLVIKSKSVKFNGVLLTCAIDTFIIAGSYLIIWSAYAIFAKLSWSFVYSLILIVVILMLLAMYCLYKQHIRLSNEQLDVISISYYKECSKLVSQFFKRCR